MRRDTFRNCFLTFSHMIPTGADLRKDRTWTRSQCTPDLTLAHTMTLTSTTPIHFHNLSIFFIELTPFSYDLSHVGFGASCSLDLKLGTTTHLVCGKAGTDKVHAALKSTQPLFIVNRQWLFDSMDHFQRQVLDRFVLMRFSFPEPFLL